MVPQSHHVDSHSRDAGVGSCLLQVDSVPLDSHEFDHSPAELAGDYHAQQVSRSSTLLLLVVFVLKFPVFFFGKHMLFGTSLPSVLANSMPVLHHSTCCCHRIKYIGDILPPSLSLLSSVSFPCFHSLHYCLI